MQRRGFLFGLAASALAAGGTRAAPIAGIKALKPGEYLWHPELSPDGPVVVVVSLPLQLVHVYRNGIVIAVSTCSTGMPGHRTPTGVFTILQKNKTHFSSTYNNAPMPNMQRLTWQGVALHAGQLPGYPASHGCIRLPTEFSRLLFTVTGLGTSVIIADNTSTHKSVAQPSLILPNDVSEAAKDASESAAAARKSAGAKKAGEKKTGDKPAADKPPFASILVSSKDRKAYLIVDGQVTFETPVKIFDETTPLGTHLYSLVGPSKDGVYLSWNSFDLGGDPEKSTTVDLWTDPTLARVEYVDGPGVRAVAQTLRPGTTMVITDFAATPETRTGPDFTVITEDRAVRGKRVRD
jgi:hypothetical protein